MQTSNSSNEQTDEQTKFPLSHMWNILLALFVFAIGLTITQTYLSAERVYYFWDWAGFEAVAADQTYIWKSEPATALKSLFASLGTDYNYYYTLPLIPILAAAGPSRQVYLASITLLYLIPYFFVIGWLGTLLLPRRKGTFWLVIFIAICTPVLWLPTLRNFPDTSGALLLAVAMGLYLRQMDEHKWWTAFVVGISLGGAVLLRRHFIYAAIVFFAVAGIQSGWAFLCEWFAKPAGLLRSLYAEFIYIFTVGIAAGLTLLTMGLPFLHNLLTVNYYGLYASYLQPYASLIHTYVPMYGWAALLSAASGLFLGWLLNPRQRRRFSFVILLFLFSVLQWFVVVRQSGIQYSLHFSVYVVLGLAALGHSALLKLGNKPLSQVLLLAGVSVYLLANMTVALTPWDFLKASEVRTLFAEAKPPWVRDDFDEVARLVDYLRNLPNTDKPIYVAGSSRSINFDVIAKAELRFYGRDDRILNILSTPQVDSRDFLPLEMLLKSDYVVLSSPVQYHMSPAEQDLVRIAVALFEEGWPISNDFEKLPAEFKLQTVSRAGPQFYSKETNFISTVVYQRIHPTAPAIAIDTLERLRAAVQPLPGGQADWIVIDELFPAYVIGKLGDPHTITTHVSDSNQERKTLLLYIHPFLGKGVVFGRLNFLDNLCAGARLNALSIDRQGIQTLLATSSHRPSAGDTTKFALPFAIPAESYLMLELTTVEENEHMYNCSLRLENIIVDTY